MSDEGKPMKPEYIFKKVVWRNILQLGPSIESWTTWTITGVGATIAIFISNIDSVSKIVTKLGIKYSLIFFTLSLVFGTASKLIGRILFASVSIVKEIEATLYSKEAKNLMDTITIPLKEMIDELSDPFLWPMNKMMKKAGKKGIEDYLTSDRQLVKMFCLQLYFDTVHFFLASLALLLIAFSLY
jgi:hypothetical protein